jgi:hypothetical protein
VRTTLGSHDPHGLARRPLLDFIAVAGRCWRMVYDRNLQATHCGELPAWTGRWRKVVAFTDEFTA